MSTSVKTIDTISLSEIQIPIEFIQRLPRQEKLDTKKAYVQKHGELEQPLIVHPITKQLIDGWAGYLAIKEMGKNTAQVEWGTKKRPQPLTQHQSRPIVEIPQEVRLAVWKAEDGRCEACKRAMDQGASRFCRIDPTKNDWSANNLHLLCVDCKEKKPGLLDNLSVSDAVGKELAPYFLMSEEETIKLLPELLRLYGVIFLNGKFHRIYWLPGVGVFHVALQNDPRVTKIEKIYKKPRMKSKPQAATRGLPKPHFARKHTNL